MGDRVAKYRKLLVAAAGLIAQIINLNVASGTVRDWLVAALAALTAVGVYTVPNTPASPPATVSEPPTTTPAPTNLGY